MSKLREMKSPASQDSGSPLYTIIAVLIVVAFAWMIYFYVFVPGPKVGLGELEGKGHFTGSPDAKVRIVEFSDFQCPACGAAEPVVQKILAEFKGRVKFTYRHFPISQIHPYAQKAAEASECAAEQGRFWEMHGKLFANQQSLTQDDLKRHASDLGLDTAKFNACLASGKMGPVVASDLSYGLSIGVDSTPTFFINGEKRSGMSYEEFKSAVLSKS